MADRKLPFGTGADIISRLYRIETSQIGVTKFFSMIDGFISDVKKEMAALIDEDGNVPEWVKPKAQNLALAWNIFEFNFVNRNNPKFLPRITDAKRIGDKGFNQNQRQGLEKAKKAVDQGFKKVEKEFPEFYELLLEAKKLTANWPAEAYKLRIRQSLGPEYLAAYGKVDSPGIIR